MMKNRKTLAILASVVIASSVVAVSAASVWFNASNSFTVAADFQTSGTMAIALGDYTAPSTTPCTGGPSTFTCPDPTAVLYPNSTVTYFSQVETQLPDEKPLATVDAGSYSTLTTSVHYAPMTSLNGNIDGPVVAGPITLQPNQAYWVAITVQIASSPTLGPVTWTMSFGE
jgi:hypothetical protein